MAAVVYEQSGKSAFVAVSMTSAYAALSGGYDLDVPDLSAAAGFDASRALSPGVRVDWTAFRIGGTLPTGRGAIPVNGATRRTGGTQGTIASP